MKDTQLFLIKYGELGLKGKNRNFFIHALIRNMKALLGKENVEIGKTHGRLYLRTKQPTHQVIQSLQKVFGIVKIASARECPLDLQNIKEQAASLVEEALGEQRMSFKVETRRPNKSFPLDSMEMSRELGAYLLQRFSELYVDVTAPQLRLQVELRQRAYIYLQDESGPGGLPVGTGGKGVLLLSGGIDSPVAGWTLLKRGLEVLPLHFHSAPYTNERSLEKVKDLVRTVQLWGLHDTLFLIHFTELQEILIEHTPNAYLTLLMRRMMMRIGQALAETQGAQCLITGESLGQVASQTIESMHATGAVAQYPVLRPLVGMDKEDIINLAKEIGTYEISIQPHEDCCQVFVPQHPVTRPVLKKVEAIEKGIPWQGAVEKAVEEVEFLSLKA